MIFGLPRPFFADARVACLDPGWDTAAAFRAMGGEGFFDLPAQAVIDAFRQKGMSFGFPSGHASGAVALWGGLAVVFRKRALAWLAPFLVALVAFTRLYLGVHFLADVLGGILLGGLVLFAAWRLIGSDSGAGTLLRDRPRPHGRLPARGALLSCSCSSCRCCWRSFRCSPPCSPASSSA